MIRSIYQVLATDTIVAGDAKNEYVVSWNRRYGEYAGFSVWKIRAGAHLESEAHFDGNDRVLFGPPSTFEGATRCAQDYLEEYIRQRQGVIVFFPR